MGENEYPINDRLNAMLTGTEIRDMNAKVDGLSKQIIEVDKKLAVVIKGDSDRQKIDEILNLHERVTTLEKGQWKLSGAAGAIASGLTLVGQWIISNIGSGK